MEGLEVATPELKPYVVPLTIAILVGLFSVQRIGTGGVGRVFGWVMLLWFTTLAVLGIKEVFQTPEVLKCVNPAYAWQFFSENGWRGFHQLGAVFLVLTGAEALYADMGHFGKKPIRIAWFGLVLPALFLNYLGQGALGARRSQHRHQSILPPGAILGAVSARRARHGSGSHRLASAHLRLVLAHHAGRATRLHATRRHRTHLLLHARSDLHSVDQLGLDVRVHRPRAGFSILRESRRRLRHRRGADHAHHHPALLLHSAATLEMESGSDRRLVRRVSRR